MGIEDDESAPAFVPVLDVLADQIFEELALSRAGRTAAIQVFVSGGAGENQAGVSAGKQAKIEVVAGRRAH